MRAGASLRGSVEGANFTYDGNFWGHTEFAVADPGDVSGSWSLDATADFTASGSVSFDLDLTHTGDGQISGHPRTLTLSGTETTSSGGSSNTNPFEISIDVVTVVCDTLYGDWVRPLDVLAQEAGWTQRDIEGDFVAVAQDRVTDRQTFQKQKEKLDREIGELEVAFDSGEGIDLQKLGGLLDRAERMYRHLADDPDCAPTEYANWLGLAMLDLVDLALDSPGKLSASDLRTLALALARTGATELRGGQKVENRLRKLTETRFDEALDADNLDDARTLAMVQAQMGWSEISQGDVAVLFPEGG